VHPLLVRLIIARPYRGELLDGLDVIDFFSGQRWYSTPKYVEKVCHHCNGEVMLQSNWDLAVDWVQVPCVREAEAARCRNVELEASVVVGGVSKVETVGCMWRSGCLGSQINVYQCFGS
jgi:hypothetical protein